MVPADARSPAARVETAVALLRQAVEASREEDGWTDADDIHFVIRAMLATDVPADAEGYRDGAGRFRILSGLLRAALTPEEAQRWLSPVYWM
jgi:hypothetical protein